MKGKTQQAEEKFVRMDFLIEKSQYNKLLRVCKRRVGSKYLDKEDISTFVRIAIRTEIERGY